MQKIRHTLFIILFISLLGEGLHSTTYYVKTNGNDINGLSWTNAFSTINQAASIATAGDTVIVSNGVYEEAVTAANSGTEGAYITYKAYNPGTAILQGSIPIARVFNITSKNYIRIYGFRVQDAFDFGFFIQGSCSNIEIINNISYNNQKRGMSIGGAKNFLIASNIFYGDNQMYGLILGGGGNNIIRDNIAYKTSESGLYITSPSNLIVNNNCYSNGTSGIEIAGGRGNITRDNILHNNARGIQITATTPNEIVQNQIYDNNDGVYCSSCASNIIYQNQIYSNSSSGIRILDGRDLSIFENNIYGPNQNRGIWLMPGSYNRIVNNRIYKNSDRGIDINNSSGTNLISNNNIISNSSYGISFSGNTPDGNTIISNRIIGNQYGIYSDWGKKNRICYNLIGHNYSVNSVGLFLSSNTTNLQVINNTIYNNYRYGIRCDSFAHAYIVNNIIMSNGTGGSDYAIRSESFRDIFVAYNDFYGNVNLTNVGNGLIWGKGNIYDDPVIDKNIPHEILSSASPVIDKGTNIAGITYNFSGNAPDMGWKEYQDTTPPVSSANKKSGFYSESFQVILTGIDPEAPDDIKIYYTKDGSDPKTSSTAQNALSPVTIQINNTTTLKFYAQNSFGLSESTINTRQYDFIKIPSDDVAVYNNHLDLTKNEKAKIIFGKPVLAEIKIYTIRGILVKSFIKQNFNTGDFKEWDGTIKDTGIKCGSGLYIVVVKGDINKKLKMIIKK